MDFLKTVCGGDGRLSADGPDALALVEILDQLEEGEVPARVANRAGLGPRRLIEALALGALREGSHLGLVRGEPWRPQLRSALGIDALTSLWPKADEAALYALSAGLLQIYDFWDASHDAAQRADDLGDSRSAAFWHGIAHRREPDFGNASYWFRRVGKHDAFEALGVAAGAKLDGWGETPSPEGARIVRGGVWDPIAFLAFCRSARPHTPVDALARSLQACEMAVLLDASLAAVA